MFLLARAGGENIIRRGTNRDLSVILIVNYSSLLSSVPPSSVLSESWPILKSTKFYITLRKI